MGDSRGKKVWEAVKVVNAFWWLVALPFSKTAGILLILLATRFAVISSLPLWQIVLLGVGVVVLLIVLMILLRIFIDLFFGPQEIDPYQIDVEYTCMDGYSSRAGITITNMGADRTFRAECQIVQSNQPPNYPQGRFTLGWDDGTKSSFSIARHMSAFLLIANFEHEMQTELWQMTINKAMNTSSHEHWSARWGYGDPDLPKFFLKVFITAEGAAYPWTKTFQVTPERSTGPLMLTEVGL